MNQSPVGKLAPPKFTPKNWWERPGRSVRRRGGICVHTRYRPEGQRRTLLPSCDYGCTRNVAPGHRGIRLPVLRLDLDRRTKPDCEQWQRWYIRVWPRPTQHIHRELAETRRGGLFRHPGLIGTPLGGVDDFCRRSRAFSGTQPNGTVSIRWRRTAQRIFQN